MYFLLGFIIGGVIFCICLLYKIFYIFGDILFKVNEIKKYQYTNNLKMYGFMKNMINELQKRGKL